MRKARFALTIVGALAFLGVSSGTAFAQVKADPWIFIGKLAQCAPSPAGGKIVYSNWLAGMGLPDNGTSSNPNGVQQGLLLNKNGPTPNCSSAGATITGLPATVTVTTLGFDYRNGGHCGAGAPRFNVVTGSGTAFYGCAAGVQTPAPQDPANWTRVTITIPPTLITAGIDDIHIVFDEGTDTVSPGNPEGIGLAVLDNVRVNGTYITRKAGNAYVP